MGWITQMTTAQTATVCAFLILIFFGLPFVFSKLKLKTKLFTLGTGEEASAAIDRCDRIRITAGEYEREFHSRYINYLSQEVIVVAGMFPAFIPKLWRFIIANCITDALTESIIHNHIAEKFTDEKQFNAWLIQNDIKAKGKLEIYKSCMSSLNNAGDARWQFWLHATKEQQAANAELQGEVAAEDVLREIRVELYNRMRSEYIEFLKKVIFLYDGIKDTPKGAEMHEVYINLLNAVSNNWAWFKERVKK